MLRQSVRVLLAGGLTTSALASGGAAAAQPPTIPGPMDPGYCGAHTSAWDCWSDVSPARAGELAFINERLKYDMPGLPTDRGRLLQIARGVCQSLVGGTHPNYIVQWLAQDIGAAEDQTGQMFIMINDTAC